jgi:hypothetical protein
VKGSHYAASRDIRLQDTFHLAQTTVEKQTFLNHETRAPRTGFRKEFFRDRNSRQRTT